MDKEDLKKLIEKIIFDCDSNVRDNSKNNDFAELTLSSGLPGVIFLLSEFEDIIEQENYYNKINEYIEYIVKKISNYGLVTGSLYSGASGIALSIYHMKHINSNYSNLIESLNKYIDYYVREKIKQIDLEEISPTDYDVIEGLSGILSYLLLLDESNYYDLKNLIIDFLSKLLCSEGNLGIYVKSQNQMSEVESLMYPEGCLNLGFAHGLAGVGSILAYAQVKGFKSKLSELAIKNIISIYERFELKEKGGHIWKDGIVKDEIIDGKVLREANFARDAWCYGSPGVSMLYLYVGLIENDKYLLSKSERILQEAMKRKLGVSSSMICHGNAGLIEICLLFKKLLGTNSFDSYIEDFNNEFEVFYREYKKNGISGFLEGVIGCLLTYLDVNNVSNCTYWHKTLLIFDDFLENDKS